MTQSHNSAKAKREARRERRRRDARTEILDAARKAVLREGFAAFSLTSVAEELGLTKPALYYYFVSREALMFELLLDEWLMSAREVQEAVAGTTSGADAVEALMRTTFARYRHRLDMFRLVYMAHFGGTSTDLIGPEELRRIRPINDMLYGGAEARLRADQAEGVFPSSREPRRFAFTAHMAVIGLLNMKALAESASDPLIHSDDELIDDVCTTFRNAATGGTP